MLLYSASTKVFLLLEFFGVLARYVLSVSKDILFFWRQIRQNDRLAVSKLVTSLTRGSVRSPLAQCLLIRYTCQVVYNSCYLVDSRMMHQCCHISALILLHKNSQLQKLSSKYEILMDRSLKSQVQILRLEIGRFMIFLRSVWGIRTRWWFLRLLEQWLNWEELPARNLLQLSLYCNYSWAQQNQFYALQLYEPSTRYVRRLGYLGVGGFMLWWWQLMP